MFVVSPTLRSIELLWFIAAFLLKKCNYMGRSRKISYLYCATKGHVHVVGMLPKNKPFKLRDENIDDVKDYYTLNRTKHQNVCYSKCFIKTLEHTKLVTFGWIKEALRGLWLAKWLIRGSFLQSVISRIRSITVRKENNNHCVETCACHKNYGDLVDGWVKRLLHTTQRSSLPKPSPDLFALYLVNLLLNEGGRERKRKNQRQLLDNPLHTETYSLLYGQLAFQSSARRKLHKTTTPIEPHTTMEREHKGHSFVQWSRKAIITIVGVILALVVLGIYHRIIVIGRARLNDLPQTKPLTCKPINFYTSTLPTSWMESSAVKSSWVGGGVLKV